MKKTFTSILMLVLAFALLVSSMGLGVFQAAADEPVVITHTFGGPNGEWELDTDNSEGVWSYYTTYGMISTIQPTVLKLTGDQTGRTTGELYYALNKDGFMHPGASSPWSMPVVALTMEESGTLKAVMNAYKAEGNGNGVVVKFFRNSDAGRLVEKTLVEAGNHTMEAEVKVNKGDVIYFMVHHNNDIVSDGATYVLNYTLTVGEGATDDTTPPEIPTVDPSEPEPTEPAPTEPAPTVPPVVCCEDPCNHTEDTCYCAADCECATCAAYQDTLTGKTDYVSSIDDFRSVQGFSNLTYLYGLVSEGFAGLKPFEQNIGTMWDTAGVIPYLGIRADGLMHPGLGMGNVLYQPALVWTAPQDMVIDVYFDAVMELAENGGDGVVLYIYLNEKCLKVIDMQILEGKASTEPVVVEFNTIKVNEGDTLAFLLDPKTNIACDGTLTYVEITFEKTETPNTGNTGNNGNAGNNGNQSGSNNQTDTAAEQGDFGWIWIAVAGAVVVVAAVIVVIIVKKKKSDNK